MSSPSSHTVITSTATTLFRLFCTGRFEVPWHQRRYDWKPEHVDELLHDFADAIDADRRCYFLGTVILVESGPSRWRINDGQQRMVTMSLICASLLRLFTDHNDSHRAHMALRVLFDIDENSTDALDDIARLPPRLTPPRDDKTRYHLMISGRSVGANGKLTLAWRQIDTFLAGMGLDKATRFFDFLMRRVEVALLHIPVYVDPNSVYETINCRGKQLDDLDLIRNHLYSHFNAEEDAARRDVVHESLESIRVQLRDDSKYAEYARCYFQSRYGFLQKTNFYRETRRRIQSEIDHAPKGSDYVYELVCDFARRENVELFRVISASSQGDHFVEEFVRRSGHANSKRSLSMFLRELHAYKVTQPLLFALLSRYVAATDGRARRGLGKWVHARIKHVTSFVMRTAFVAPKFEPSHFESEFAALAAEVLAAGEVSEVDVDGCLKDCDSAYGIINDKKFRMKIADIKMRDMKKAKRFLFGVNCYVQADGDLMSESRCTVEHVLPKASRHWTGWGEFAGENPEDWVHCVGNLTLLGRHDNKPGDAQNRDFFAKRDGYSNSAVEITRDVAACEQWAPKEIVKRQKRLAAVAARVWSFEPSMSA